MFNVKTFILTFLTCTLFRTSGYVATYDNLLSFITVIVATVVMCFFAKHIFDYSFDRAWDIGFNAGFIVGKHYDDKDGEDNGN